MLNTMSFHTILSCILSTSPFRLTSMKTCAGCL
uniref:Uncharacterized protein n=1 Tax=Rhizophora mucronata TaxID=61149 RepID=A0A2P2P3G4_RHIMU